MDLAKKHVVVTGGASGIGRAVVEGFLDQGARVSFLDIDASTAETLLDRYQDRTLSFAQCDVSDISALQLCLSSFEEMAPIDVLVNNAANDKRYGFFDIRQEDWDWSQYINLRHQFFATQAVANFMKARGEGAIVNMGSVSWMRARAGMAGYTAAKAAIYGFTRSAARELGDLNIRVNSVAPGAVDTERQRRLWVSPENEADILASQALKFRLKPEHVVPMVLFLASEEAAGCTGQTFVVDAGISLN